MGMWYYVHVHINTGLYIMILSLQINSCLPNLFELKKHIDIVFSQTVSDVHVTFSTFMH